MTIDGEYSQKVKSGLELWAGCTCNCCWFKQNTNNIAKLNNCNNCAKRKTCGVLPTNEYVRINCFLWEPKVNEL